MDKIKIQSNKVGELLFASTTGEAYKKALSLTWDIVRETGILIWLVICLVFVGAEWFWKNSISLGSSVRAWYENVSTPKSEEPQSANAISQSLLSALGSGTDNLLYQAKQQLGMDAKPPASRSLASKPAMAASADKPLASVPAKASPAATQSPAATPPASEAPKVKRIITADTDTSSEEKTS